MRQHDVGSPGEPLRALPLVIPLVLVLPLGFASGSVTFSGDADTCLNHLPSFNLYTDPSKCGVKIAYNITATLGTCQPAGRGYECDVFVNGDVAGWTDFPYEGFGIEIDLWGLSTPLCGKGTTSWNGSHTHLACSGAATWSTTVSPEFCGVMVLEPQATAMIKDTPDMPKFGGAFDFYVNAHDITAAGVCLDADCQPALAPWAGNPRLCQRP